MKTLQPLEQALPKLNDWEKHYFEYWINGDPNNRQDRGLMTKAELSKGSPEPDIEVWVLAEEERQQEVRQELSDEAIWEVARECIMRGTNEGAYETIKMNIVDRFLADQALKDKDA